MCPISGFSLLHHIIPAASFLLYSSSSFLFFLHLHELQDKLKLFFPPPQHAYVRCLIKTELQEQGENS